MTDKMRGTVIDEGVVLAIEQRDDGEETDIHCRGCNDNPQDNV